VSNPFEDPVASRPPYQQQQHTGAQYPRPQGIFLIALELTYLVSPFFNLTPKKNSISVHVINYFTHERLLWT
jgi:hypothetical protein